MHVILPGPIARCESVRNPHRGLEVSDHHRIQADRRTTEDGTAVCSLIVRPRVHADSELPDGGLHGVEFVSLRDEFGTVRFLFGSLDLDRIGDALDGRTVVTVAGDGSRSLAFSKATATCSAWSPSLSNQYVAVPSKYTTTSCPATSGWQAKVDGVTNLPGASGEDIYRAYIEQCGCGGHVVRVHVYPVERRPGADVIAVLSFPSSPRSGRGPDGDPARPSGGSYANTFAETLLVSCRVCQGVPTYEQATVESLGTAGVAGSGFDT